MGTATNETLAMQESFKQDRAWHTTDELPDIEDVKTLQDQYAYQRILRRKWEECEIPSELPFEPDCAAWWQFPYNPSPDQINHHNKRYLKRLQNDE
jgi:hypothetical protein